MRCVTGHANDRLQHIRRRAFFCGSGRFFPKLRRRIRRRPHCTAKDVLYMPGWVCLRRLAALSAAVLPAAALPTAARLLAAGLTHTARQRAALRAVARRAGCCKPFCIHGGQSTLSAHRHPRQSCAAADKKEPSETAAMRIGSGGILLFSGKAAALSARLLRQASTPSSFQIYLTLPVASLASPP